MQKTAFIFPGQGAQIRGMGVDFAKNFSESKQIFEEASDRLGCDMLQIVAQADDKILMQTETTQPAILTASIAMLAALKSVGFDCDFTAGLSLGEYSALVLARSISFSDAVYAAKERGKIMQSAAPRGEGNAAAIIGLSYEEVSEFLKLVKGDGVVEIANFNSPRQIAVSGDAKAVREAIDVIGKRSRAKILLLPVSVPVHSSLLRDCSKIFAKILDEIQIFPAQKAVVSNVDAKIEREPSEIKSNLVKQFYSTVLWSPSVEFMIERGVVQFVEIGPGRSLSGLLRQIALFKRAEISIQNVSDMETFKNLNLN